MASSSTSSSIHKTSFKYDVFLSFRGEDTRTSFVDHLYHALKLENIETYKDDRNLERGKKISKELIQAIEESRYHVVVFSKNYASSSWCLDELVKVMECQQTLTDHSVYPIFYDVEPTHVRKQSGEFGQAFSKHANDENAEKWRKALVEATSLSGRELRTTADGHEAEFIKLVVKDISSKLPTVYADGNLIGMRTRINVVVSSLSTFPNEICMIGLTGMGGVGKTTLARAVFDHICKEFEGSSFIENVRESSNSLLLGLKSLQQQVLREVLNRQDIIVNGVFDGKTKMKKHMPSRKVLLVLDDVDHIDQLKALAGEPNWFMKGSRIIITTRDKQVLVAHKVNSIHDVSLLTDEEAICLLSRCAFGTEIPSSGYKELSEKVVSYAAGLPLTITILGWEKHKAIRALESCGFHAIRGLNVLEKKSLVSTRYGYLDMHDHLQEMGRYIVRRLHLEEPNKHSRLWIDEEIIDILANVQGTNEAIRCIELVNSKINPEIVMKGLGNMKQVRFLRVYGKSYFDTDWKFDEFCRYFPDALRWLSWEGYPFLSLPKSFQANNLVALQMRYSKIVELWEDEDRKVLHKLRFLDLGDSKLKNLDLGLTPNLERLSLNGCRDLVELRMPVECPKLIYLDLRASTLTILDLRGTLNIEELYLRGCVDLVAIHIPVECLKLVYIYINSSKLKTLDLRGTPNIKELHLEGCVDLVELHIPVECLKLESVTINGPKLRTLDLRGTPNIEKLHLEKCVDLINSSKLRTLDLRGTPNIEKLDLEECVDLVELHIHGECLKLESINLTGAKLRTFDFGWTPKLKTLCLIECYYLVELQARDGCLKKLCYIDLSGCLRLDYFFFLRPVKVGCVSKLHLIVESLNIHPRIFGNDFPKFLFACFYEEHGPPLIGNLEKLISFCHYACTNLEYFSESICGLLYLTNLTLEGSIPEAPKDLDRLEWLEELHLLSTKITHLPDSICMLKHLKCLELNPCRLLEKLPEDLGRLECLEKLILSECVFLRDIPNSICKMKRLECFHLRYCVAVEKLPEELGRLECLKELNIEGTFSPVPIDHLNYFAKKLCALRFSTSVNRRIIPSSHVMLKSAAIKILENMPLVIPVRKLEQDSCVLYQQFTMDGYCWSQRFFCLLLSNSSCQDMRTEFRVIYDSRPTVCGAVLLLICCYLDVNLLIQQLLV
ncbi:hypothetical protein OSB04_015923 [Centaurea solstitialis]|uniref:TIR domain-containing protein n=1 Tax=Centaurea solstitialis TaxID=347529 RepID=A0AA38T029_9ASTR|nr:hypothetical protein OSB04_015923 [Centaurea solstitialis]